MNCGFSQHARLRNRRAFRFVYEEGKFVANYLIAIHYVPKPVAKHRIGFTAGKRLGNAVLRNRCKRRLKEQYRLNKHLIPDGIDLIVVARKALVKCEWEQIGAAFRDVISRIKVKKTLT